MGSKREVLECSSDTRTRAGRNLLVIVSNVIVHHDDYMVIRNTMRVQNVIGVAHVGLEEKEIHNREGIRIPALHEARLPDVYNCSSH